MGQREGEKCILKNVSSHNVYEKGKYSKGRYKYVAFSSSCPSRTAAHSVSLCDLYNISLKQRGVSYSQLQVGD